MEWRTNMIQVKVWRQTKGINGHCSQTAQSRSTHNRDAPSLKMSPIRLLLVVFGIVSQNAVVSGLTMGWYTCGFMM